MFSDWLFRIICCNLAVWLVSNHAIAGVVLNPDNGHYYEVVNIAKSWDDADLDARSRTYNGSVGYLVTITSVSENLFLTSTFTSAGLHYLWTGGLQLPGSTEPAGGWAWANGEAFSFQNWWTGGEPSNTGGVENRIIFDHGVTANGKSWNDLNGSVSSLGYVVEYNGSSGPVVPEPATLSIFGLGAAGFALARRTRLLSTKR